MTRLEINGVAGTGFCVELPPGDDRPNPDTMTCLSRWNLTLPGQHPLWNRYMLAVCHLRDCDGITPAKKHFPEATHELSVFAVDPSFPEEKFQQGGTAILEPVNHACQFVTTDANAYEIARRMAQRLVDGQEFSEPSGITGARDRFKESIEFLVNELR